MVSVFHQEWWLNAATDGAWEMLESVPRSGVTGRLPIHIRRYFGQPIICLPPWTRTLGPIVSEPPAKRTTLLRARYGVMEDLIRKLPAHRVFKQVFDPSITDLLAFQLNGFDVGVQYTFRLHDCANLDAIWHGMRDKTRNVIRRAEEQFKVGIDMSAAQFAAFYFAHCDTCPRHSQGRLEPLIRAALQHNAGTVLYCAKGGDHVAAVVMVWDDVCSYFLVSARDERRAGNGAISLLLWEALKLAGRKGLIFDFDAFANRGGAMFVSQFGGELVPRWTVSYLPSVVRLGYAPRSTIARWKAAILSPSRATRPRPSAAPRSSSKRPATSLPDSAARPAAGR